MTDEIRVKEENSFIIVPGSNEVTVTADKTAVTCTVVEGSQSTTVCMGSDINVTVSTVDVSVSVAENTSVVVVESAIEATVTPVENTGVTVTVNELATSFTGVTAHNDLTGKSAANQHPISAITGLQSELDSVLVDAGDMKKLIYDPTGKETDTFNAGNLYGNLDGGTFN